MCFNADLRPLKKGWFRPAVEAEPYHDAEAARAGLPHAGARLCGAFATAALAAYSSQ